MHDAVTYSQFKRALIDLGFQATESGPSHVIFRHPPTGAVLTVPKTERRVRPIYVLNAIRQVENTGIASAATFESMLKQAQKNAAPSLHEMPG